MILLATFAGCGDSGFVEPVKGPVASAQEARTARADSAGSLERVDHVASCAAEDDLADAASSAGSSTRVAEVEHGSSVAASAQLPSVEPYEGKYRSDGSFGGRVAVLQAEVATALSTVGRRLGLEEGPPPLVRIRLRDGLAVWPKHEMSVHTEDDAAGPVQVLTVVTEPLMAGTLDVRGSALHEAVHCWHLARRGSDYRRTPPWIREGVAQWISGDGESAVLMMLNTECAENREIGSLLERARAEMLGGARVHWYSYAAISFAQTLVSSERRDEFARSLLFDQDWSRTMERYTGLDAGAFFTRMAPWVEGDIVTRLKGVEHFSTAWDEAGAGNLGSAAEAYGAFTRRHPGHALASRAYYEWGRCLYRCGDLVNARTRLLDAKAVWPHGPCRAYIDRLEFLIDCRLGRSHDLQSRGEMLLRDYSYWPPNYLESIREEMRRLAGLSTDADVR